jgi:hypothetical protein
VQERRPVWSDNSPTRSEVSAAAVMAAACTTGKSEKRENKGGKMITEAVLSSFQKARYFEPGIYHTWTVSDGKVYVDIVGILFWSEHGYLPKDLTTDEMIAQTKVLHDFAHEHGYDAVLALIQGWHGLALWPGLPPEYYDLGRNLAVSLGAVNPDCPWQKEDWSTRVRAFQKAKEVEHALA